jgi:hypothetical protein
MALAVRLGPFEGPKQDQGCIMGPAAVSVPEVTEVVSPDQY